MQHSVRAELEAPEFVIAIHERLAKVEPPAKVQPLATVELPAKAESPAHAGGTTCSFFTREERPMPRGRRGVTSVRSDRNEEASR